MDNEIPNVSRIEENDRTTCVVDDSCFNIPVGYNHLGMNNKYITITIFKLFTFWIWIESSLITGADTRRQFSIEEEDDLLQYAIQQSLIEVGSEKDEVSVKQIAKGLEISCPICDLVLNLSWKHFGKIYILILFLGGYMGSAQSSKTITSNYSKYSFRRRTTITKVKIVINVQDATGIQGLVYIII